MNLILILFRSMFEKAGSVEFVYAYLKCATLPRLMCVKAKKRVRLKSIHIYNMVYKFSDVRYPEIIARVIFVRRINAMYVCDCAQLRRLHGIPIAIGFGMCAHARE